MNDKTQTQPPVFSPSIWTQDEVEKLADRLKKIEREKAGGILRAESERFQRKAETDLMALFVSEKKGRSYGDAEQERRAIVCLLLRAEAFNAAAAMVEARSENINHQPSTT